MHFLLANRVKEVILCVKYPNNTANKLCGWFCRFKQIKTTPSILKVLEAGHFVLIFTFHFSNKFFPSVHIKFYMLFVFPFPLLILFIEDFTRAEPPELEAWNPELEAWVLRLIPV